MDKKQKLQLLKTCTLQSVSEDEKVKFSELYGVSNSAKVIDGGIQIGGANLETINKDITLHIFSCVLKFPPEDEVYFAFHVKNDLPQLYAILAEMADQPNKEPIADFKFASSGRNNNVAIGLAQNGRLYFRNKGHWNALDFDLKSIGGQVGIGVEVDNISVAFHPNTPSARRSLLAREFVGYLGRFVGKEKIQELSPWPDETVVSEKMRRLPHTVDIKEIKSEMDKFGGHYIDDLIERFHIAINHNPDKHFVILSGLSGTGKTQLPILYSKIIHGVTDKETTDPYFFMCPVRPEWTDPTGLTGYHDLLTDKYIVPTFLEAILIASANKDIPIFVCLDEMNLARVEYYFSDILSSIESRTPIQLHSNSLPIEGSIGGEIRGEIILPQNIYIIGTINIDETTNPLSDKILDRALILDMSKVDLKSYFKTMKKGESDLYNSMKACGDTITELNNILTNQNVGFGYRVAKESLQYHKCASELLTQNTDQIIDELLVQKLLTKIRGAEKQRPMLEELLAYLKGHSRACSLINVMIDDLDEFGSFQTSR